MELQDFIAKFAEAVEIESVDNLNGDTKFRELEDWSSLSVMFTIAFYDEEFSKEIGDKDIRNCITINDLYQLAIG